MESVRKGEKGSAGWAVLRHRPVADEDLLNLCMGLGARQKGKQCQNSEHSRDKPVNRSAKRHPLHSSHGNDTSFASIKIFR
jgi:hypothetical protein